MNNKIWKKENKKADHPHKFESATTPDHHTKTTNQLKDKNDESITDCRLRCRFEQFFPIFSSQLSALFLAVLYALDTV